MFRYSTIVAALVFVGSAAAASATEIDSEGNYLMDPSKGAVSAAEPRVHRTARVAATAPRFIPATVMRKDPEGDYWMDRSKGSIE